MPLNTCKVASVAFLLALPAAGWAQRAQTQAHPSVRIKSKVDNALTTRIAGSRPGFTRTAEIGQQVAPGTELRHLHLVLTSSADQQAALEQLMAEQQDKTSANFHKWLTPEEFGEHFGASQSDIATVTAWMADQGLTVSSVSKSGRFIEFSGSAASIQTAFHTELRHVTLNGKTHISNTTEISIPEALAPVIAGVARLNDVFPTVHPGPLKTVKLGADPATSHVTVPFYTGANGSPHYISPGDAAVIYNTTPLTAAGIDGTGQSITILAQSNIDVTNVEQFRSMFGLPKNNPTVTVVGADPGLNGDDGEAYLDAEWGGSLATGAKINFLVSSPSFEGGGVEGAGAYAVENNLGDIISLSYGGCEYNDGASYTSFWNTLWQQAAAQGQTALVSSGDSGAAGCTSSSNAYASMSTNGTQYSVNALGSSAYNVSVGGSMFVDYNPTTYWAAAGSTGTLSPFVSALSYVPEAALNQSRLTTTLLNDAATATTIGSGVFSAGGGVSIYTRRPSWQTGSGIPTNADAINVYSGTGIATGYTSDGTHRLVPDVVNISAYGHDGTLVCAGTCTVNSDGSLPSIGVYGGTSVATPVQASIQALINQKNGGRQGNVLPILYKLANAQYTASTTACQAPTGTAANPGVTLPANTCYFHDIVSGSNIVPTTSSGTAGVGFYAQAGYDEASGLGSVNAANLANAWSLAGLVTSTTTFTLSPTINITHGATQNLTVKVAGSGTATPTGDVSLIAETASPNGPRQYTLTAGSFSGTVASSAGTSTVQSTAALPAGSYNVHVHYGGDPTFAPSDSASLPVSIGKEASTAATTSYAISYATGPGFTQAATSTFTYGNGIYLDTFINPASGTGVATGAVTYALTRNGTALSPLTTSLDGIGNTYMYSGASIPTYYLKTNYGALSPGSYTATTTYAGDGTFTSSTTTNSFVVNALAATVTLYAPTNVAASATGTYSVRINNPNTSTLPNNALNPTGTVVFTATSSGNTVNLGSCTVAPFTVSLTTSYSACQISSAALTTAGSYTISAVYSGDTNYATVTKTATSTVSNLASTTTTLTATGTPVNSCGLIVNCPIALKATVSPTATGSVVFYDGSNLLGTATIASSAATFSSSSLTGGTHNISAVYSGSTTLTASTGTTSVTVAKATPVLAVSGTNASTYGQPIALGANLQVNPLYYSTQPLQPTGGVNFYDGGTLVGTGALVPEPAGYSFTTSISLPTLTAGSHNITATFVGDNNFAASTVTFNGGITVAKYTPPFMLSSTSTVYNSGANVVLTATIPLAAALAAPAGTITFYDGSTALGTATASYSAAAGGYVATFSTTALTRGVHSLTATLGSDTNYNAASGTLSININTNNVWVANGNGTVGAVSSTGAVVTPATINGGGTAIAIDNAGYIWSVSKGNQSVTRFTSTGGVVGTYTGSGTIVAPSALAIDGAGLVWITNGSTTLTAVTPAGTAIAAKAFQTGFSTPSAIKIDASGNLWVTNTGDNSVSEVIGVATPVITPQTNAVKNATPAAKP